MASSSYQTVLEKLLYSPAMYELSLVRALRSIRASLVGNDDRNGRAWWGIRIGTGNPRRHEKVLVEVTGSSSPAFFGGCRPLHVPVVGEFRPKVSWSWQVR